MDRTPNRDRRPPIPPEDRYGTSRGQSYRPGNRSPVGARPERSRSPPRGSGPARDGYGSRGYARPRSRSPPFNPRRRSRSPPGIRDGYRARPRSPGPPPPRRDFDRDRDGPLRGPHPRDSPPPTRPRKRSPTTLGRPSAGNRSPLVAKRGRDISPVSSRGRYPSPPPKRERLASPDGARYRERPSPYDRSPPRRGHSPPRERRQSPPRPMYRARRPSRSPPRYADRAGLRPHDGWRRRSPSPIRRAVPDAAKQNDAASTNTSRRSTPPLVHPSRREQALDTGAVQLKDRRDEDQRRAAQPVSRPRSPLRQPSPPLTKDRSAPSAAGPPPATRSEKETYKSTVNTYPDRGPSSVTGLSAPTGPRSHVPTSIAPPRNPGTSGPTALQSGPQGGPRGRSDVSTGPAHPRERPSLSSLGDSMTPTAPSGPRSTTTSTPLRGPPMSNAPAHPRAYRSTPTGPANSSSPALGLLRRTSTLPNQHPYNHYLTNLPPILDEGKKLPDLYDRSRLDRLEEEAEKIRRLVADKQARKRKGLRDWARLEKEVQLAELRSQLAEQSLSVLAGGENVAAAF